METLAFPVDVNDPWRIWPVVDVLVIVSGTMTPAETVVLAGPWMCAALAGPVNPVTVAE